MSSNHEKVGIFRLFVVSKCFDSITAKEHRIAIKNYTSPEFEDLTSALKEVYPTMDYGTYSLYCRSGMDELCPIVDYSSLVVALKEMVRNSGAHLYLIKNDIRRWLDARPQLRRHPNQIKLTVEYVSKKKLHEENKVSQACQYENVPTSPNKTSSKIKLHHTKKNPRKLKTK
ncbi:uncharacterized protein LOC106661128 [Cimex lectularius]|uniref:Uncharacterized protein n=1 Tax=Cimex lectularius TaxID=79782 RepID=A0A8I6R6W9_CIMLE|nr:uncharacterized protein LOC106661128 [Cimex lectularius]